jgi:thiamine-monophosphate kinase
MAIKDDSGERAILRSIRALADRRGKSAVRIGIGDDCAVLTPRTGEEIVITTDFSIEGRHFRHDWHEPEAIGHKCLARGLSDIAAMGARPLAAFVSLAVPRELTIASTRKRVPQASRLRPGLSGKSNLWINRFYDGLLALAAREGVTLAGGDFSESPTLAVADIIVVGIAPKGRALLRSTAQAGDTVYVTGTLGGAAAELARLEAANIKNGAPSSMQQGAVVSILEQARHPHFYPQPRIAAGHALLRRRLATACIDISDGLSVDLLHLCEESNLSAEIDMAVIPIGAAATLEQALHGGDDYELLFTANPRTRLPKQLGGVAIQPIGRMIARQKGKTRMVLVNEHGQRTALVVKGWQHF